MTTIVPFGISFPEVLRVTSAFGRAITVWCDRHGSRTKEMAELRRLIKFNSLSRPVLACLVLMRPCWVSAAELTEVETGKPSVDRAVSRFTKGAPYG
jgi:hypothetical protein